MDVNEAIEKRRAYRSLEHVEITEEIISGLVNAARLTASCFNNQPWRFVFVKSPEQLKKMHEALSKGNEWVQEASMIIAAFAKKENDCNIREREYYLFDLGMAVSSMQLAATEMGLVAHPIAGFSPKKVREILGIPDDNMVITLINVGKKSDKINEKLNENQAETENKRPERKPVSSVMSLDSYSDELGEKSEKGSTM